MNNYNFGDNCKTNENKIDAVYIDGFKAGYTQARFDLEQESCGDAISRQSAIFLASDLKQDLPDDERIADMVMAHNEGILEYQTQLSLLPSVTPQPIECEERKSGNCPFYAN